MTDTPVALTNQKQFTAEYWDRVPRKTLPAAVHRVSTTADGYKEIICRLANGQPFRFRRKEGEISQLIMPGARAEIEVIADELVTGMFLTDERRWAFRMSSQELADYTRELASHLEQQRQATRQLMLDKIAEVILTGLDDLGLIAVPAEAAGDQEEYREMANHLALLALGALEEGP